MTVYVIDNAQQPRLFDVTRHDIKFYDPHCEIVKLDAQPAVKDTLNQLISLPLNAGDIVCSAGLAPRRHTWSMAELAIDKKINLMPGRLVDHRYVDIGPGKFFHRKPQEENGHSGCPHLMVIGDPLSAVESWLSIQQFKPEEIWTQYLPDNPTLAHWLSAVAALFPNWLTPSWFPIVDTSVRDLEIAPVMYATNHWADWIAFYPANGNFKLENHSQLYPVWLDHSEKPLEYWRNE